MRGCVAGARAWAIKGAGCAQPVSPSALQMSLGAGCPIPRASDGAERRQQRGRGRPRQGTTICAKSRRADRLGDARTACPSAPSPHPPHRLCALSPFAGLGAPPAQFEGLGLGLLRAWASGCALGAFIGRDLTGWAMPAPLAPARPRHTPRIGFAPFRPLRGWVAPPAQFGGLGLGLIRAWASGCALGASACRGVLALG